MEPTMARSVTRYNPLHAPDPAAWLATDEHELLSLIEGYHRRQGTALPDAKAHALIHLAIEGQIAADAPDVRAALQRVIADGLDRHDAVHALGFAFVGFMHDAATGKSEAECKATYATELQNLTAEGWRKATLEEGGDLNDPPGLTGKDSAQENGERMAPDEIFAQFAAEGRMPLAAIEAARADRGIMAPLFIAQVEKATAGLASETERDAIFLIFHLLGEWRETAAYRPLARMLRLPGKSINKLLGDAIIETSHRVMVAVFDGDPQPLYGVILDAEANDLIRSRMCEAIAMVALQGTLPRDEAARFLRTCHDAIKAQPKRENGCYVWVGWQFAIAALGLEELEPLVKRAFAAGDVDESWLDYDEFEQNLSAGVENQKNPQMDFLDKTFEGLFGDTVDELSDWAGFNPQEEPDSEVDPDLWGEAQAPAFNPYKGIGRNDPCPCGSGKKFKRCCLASGTAERFVA
jgi:hypothetical protein